MTKNEIIDKFNNDPFETIKWLLNYPPGDLSKVTFALEDLGSLNSPLITSVLIMSLNNVDNVIREGALRGIDQHLDLFDELDPIKGLLKATLTYVANTDLSRAIRLVANDVLYLLEP